MLGVMFLVRVRRKGDIRWRNSLAKRAGTDDLERTVPISETTAGLFYGRLFEVDPEIKALFPAGEGATQEQGRKPMQTISIAVNGMGRLDRSTPAAQDLGRRHVAYGVRDGDYDTVGAALLWTLEQGLSNDFTPRASDAWAEAYGLIVDVMKDAAVAVLGTDN